MSGTSAGGGGGFGPIATTRNADLQALGTGGQLAVQAWDQIAGHLRRRFGPEHAALLAEPNPDPDRGQTDWYAEGAAGEAPTLESLPPERQAAARAALTRLVTDVQAEAEALRRSPRENERFLGELLALALVTPGTDAVRVIGKDQPVLVSWAHARAGQAPAPELLIGLLAGRAPAAGAAGPMRILRTVPPVPRKPWLGWVLAALALLLLLLLLLLLWRDPFRWFVAAPPQCVVEADGLALTRDLRAEEAREAALRAEIARLAQGLGDRRVACPPPLRPPQPEPRRAAQPTPAQPAQTPAADAERARQQGARTGRIQVILAWDDQNDLDLSILCPDGGQISYNRKNACGGTLDIDRNAGGGQITARPVENVVFNAEPPPGRYRIRVTHYAHNRPAPATSPYRVTLRREGQPDEVFTGQIAPGQEIEVGSFESPLR